MREPCSKNRLKNRPPKGIRLGLWQPCPLPCQFSRWHIMQSDAIEGDVSLHRNTCFLQIAESCQCPHQRRFSHAIGTIDEPALTGFDDEAETCHQSFPCRTDGKVLDCQHHCPPFLSWNRKTGAPMMAVTAPTGNWMGAATLRATVSAMMRNNPPIKVDAGISHRWSGPQIRRQICGTVIPTKLMHPASETVTAVRMADKANKVF